MADTVATLYVSARRKDGRQFLSTELGARAILQSGALKRIEVEAWAGATEGEFEARDGIIVDWDIITREGEP